MSHNYFVRPVWSSFHTWIRERVFVANQWNLLVSGGVSGSAGWLAGWLALDYNYHCCFAVLIMLQETMNDNKMSWFPIALVLLALGNATHALAIPPAGAALQALTRPAASAAAASLRPSLAVSSLPSIAGGRAALGAGRRWATMDALSGMRGSTTTTPKVPTGFGGGGSRSSSMRPPTQRLTAGERLASRLPPPPTLPPRLPPPRPSPPPRKAPPVAAQGKPRVSRTSAHCIGKRMVGGACIPLAHMDSPFAAKAIQQPSSDMSSLQSSPVAGGRSAAQSSIQSTDSLDLGPFGNAMSKQENLSKGGSSELSPFAFALPSKDSVDSGPFFALPSSKGSLGSVHGDSFGARTHQSSFQAAKSVQQPAAAAAASGSFAKRMEQNQKVTILGQGFTIDQKLGTGKHGAVYSARATDGKLVAIKQETVAGMAPEAVKKQDQLFAREVENLKVLGRYRGSQVDATGNRMIIQEYMEGRSLKDVLHDVKNDPKQVENLRAKVQESLRDFHSKGLIHNDPHPGNAILTKSGKVAWVDLEYSTKPNPSFHSFDGWTEAQEELVLANRLFDEFRAGIRKP